MLLFRLREHWEEIVGPQIALHSAPDNLRFGKLFISVDSAPWMNQLTFFKKEILEKTNRFLQNKTVDEVFFNLTPLTAPKKEILLNTVPFNQTPISVSDEVLALSDAISLLQDTETRKKIATAVKGYFQKGPPQGKMSS